MGERTECNSIMELEEDKTKWNLASDLKLLDFLKTRSDEIINKINSNSSTFNQLSFETSVCSNKLNNLITNVLILTNSRFIENRVYDEDIKEINPNTSNVHYKKNDNQLNDEQAIIEKLKVSIDCGIKFLNERHGSINNGSDNQLFDRFKFLDCAYNAKNSFATRPLPFLIASDDFAKDTFVGLKVENDNPIILLNDTSNLNNQQQDSSTICQNDDNVSVDSIFDDHRSFESGPIITNEIMYHSKSNEAEDSLTNEPTLISSPKTSLIEQIAQPNLFVSSLLPDEDDIFSEPIITRTNNNSNKIIEEIKGKLSNTNNAMTNNLFDGSDSEDDIFSSVPKKSIPDNNAITDSNTAKIINKPIVPKFEEKVQNQQTLKKPTLESIFSSDDDEDDIDIFKVISSKRTNSKSVKIANNFLSDDSDDDDLFGQIKTSGNDNFKVCSSHDSLSASSETTPEKEVVLPKEITNKKVPPRQQFMSNVISELSATIKDKHSSGDAEAIIETSSSNIIEPFPRISILGSNDDSSKDISEDKPSLSVDPISSIGDFNDIVVSNSMNDILKHKAQLNAKRKRKLPTRQNIKKHLNASKQNFIDQEIDEDEEKIVFTSKDEPLSRVDPPNPQMKQNDNLFNKTPQLASPYQNSSNEDLTSDYNDKRSDLFPSPDASQKVSPKPSNIQTNSKLPLFVKSRSAFDSSDDSDEDIFNSLSKPKLTTTTVANKTEKVSLFSDSDDEDFLSTNFKSTQIKKTTTKTTEKSIVNNNSDIVTKEKQPVQLKKKSIFDDDSDEDDLFKTR